MTNEEMERAIEFLLKSQADLNAQIGRTNEQLAQTNRQLGGFADTQAEIMRVMTRTLESQAQINDSLRASIRDLSAAQRRTEEAVARLAESQAQSDQRLDALIDIVRERLEGQ